MEIYSKGFELYPDEVFVAGTGFLSKMVGIFDFFLGDLNCEDDALVFYSSKEMTMLFLIKFCAPTVSPCIFEYLNLLYGVIFGGKSVWLLRM